LASLFVARAAQKSKLHNLQYDEEGNHMAEEAEEDRQFSAWAWKMEASGMITMIGHIFCKKMEDIKI
jgi:hypothetical protein